MSTPLTRIGVFYDGNYFFKVSNYYKYQHKRQARISIEGLHEFIRHQVSTVEGVDMRLCHIVDAHFFRGRFSARSAEENQQLYNERVFDDILMGEGVVTHYLPMRNNAEKGVDVWLALEAFELAVYKRFDVLVLITGDGDFVPLARKVNSLGTRVMVIGWDFSFKDQNNEDQQTTTSIHLLDEVAYPILVSNIIDDKTKREDRIIRGLFVEPRENRQQAKGPSQSNCASISVEKPKAIDDKIYEGEVCVLKEGFGFIKCQAFPANIFFFWEQLENCEFSTLRKGDVLSFQEGRGSKGPVAVNVRCKSVS